MSDPGAYLIIRSQAPDTRFREFVERVAGDNAIVSATRLHEVAALEPGTVPMHTLVLDFPSREAARTAWASMPTALLEQPAPPLTLLVARVPASGFDDPEIPTYATVGDAEDRDPVLLLIEGTGRDEARMNTYRGIILPMMFERQSYYTVFELGGDVEVLSGEWDEAIFAISRWPSSALARDFWLCDRYQRDAIPLRLDVGEFSVAMVPEHTGGSG